MMAWFWAPRAGIPIVRRPLCLFDAAYEKSGLKRENLGFEPAKNVISRAVFIIWRFIIIYNL